MPFIFDGDPTLGQSHHSPHTEHANFLCYRNFQNVATLIAADNLASLIFNAEGTLFRLRFSSRSHSLETYGLESSHHTSAQFYFSVVWCCESLICACLGETRVVKAF